MKLTTLLNKLGKRSAPAPGYDRENLRPVIRASICTGEQTAGFRNIHTGRFTGLVYGYGDSAIHSGTFTSAVYLRGKTDVFNGTFGSAMFFYEDCTIYDGLYRSIVYMYEKEKTLTIQGGRFNDHLNAFYGNITLVNGEFTHLSDEEGSYTIKGGEFRTAELFNYLPEGTSYTETTEDGKTVYVVHTN